MTPQEEAGCGPTASGSWQCRPWLLCTNAGGCLLGPLGDVTPQEERVQQAREVGRETNGTRQNQIDAAVEVAVRVRITPELLATMDPAVGNREARLIAAFRAAGFEVEQ